MANDPLATTNMLLAIVTLISAVLGIPPVVITLVKTLRREKTQAELEVLRQIATASVAAVEQTMWKGRTNEEKLQAALELASTQLQAYGMKHITPEQLRAAIEAAVLLTKAGLQLPPPPADPQTEPAPTPVP